MRMLPFIIALCFASPSFAVDFKVNRDDTKDSYKLGGEANIGSVTVESAFVGDPVISPVMITVSVTCSRTGRSRQIASFSAFDYGSDTDRKRLSRFDEVSQTLNVFYVSGATDKTGHTQFAGNHTQTFPLAGACE